MYEHKPCTMDNLNEAISMEFVQIDRAVLKRERERERERERGREGQPPRTPSKMHR